jgi:dipeptidyl aminopeptidase/acylaminoacyl peptidase
MKKTLIALIVFQILFVQILNSQAKKPLSIKTIMQGKDFVGYWPHDVSWSADSKTIYFRWNPEKAASDSVYKIGLKVKKPVKTDHVERKLLSEDADIHPDGKYKVYAAHGEIYLLDNQSGISKQITYTVEHEEEVNFSADGQKIIFTKNNNLFSWHIEKGQIKQITNFKEGNKPEDEVLSDQQQWLKNDQLQHFKILREKDSIAQIRKANRLKEKGYYPTEIYTGNHAMIYASLSPDEHFVYYLLFSDETGSNYTKVPDYVTVDGYTDIRQARAKVGSEHYEYISMIWNRKQDSCYAINVDDLPNIKSEDTLTGKKEVIVMDPIWNKAGNHCIVDIRSTDNKDRWIALLNMQNGQTQCLDHQHDTAWIAGPGIGYYFNSDQLGWINDKTVWFQSEESGFSHLYTIDINTKEKTALTQGKFEIYNAKLSADRQLFYFTANKNNSGIRELYRFDIQSRKTEQLTRFNGRVDAFLSPDEKYIALLASTANKPWELYLMKNSSNAAPEQITFSLSDEFMEYDWMIPDFIQFEAKDGKKVPARLYQPDESNKNNAAIIFVHGAGYLQNAHQWWSKYYREYMFHNFLVENGYTVLDIDYRGSAGYGRDWRTAIYRNMGGKDLSDQVDGAKFMIEELGIDPAKIGIYGGSYGGFITLMAMFRHPEVFQCGAALRAVTDWAHYNHPYTSNILNTPQTDSTAFYRSSPIYYAEGLQGKLLICHGMVDNNVQYQDVVRLAQRLIELEKDNWEMAVYPMEGHSFKYSSSWTDEYRRIYKLFEDSLR